MSLLKNLVELAKQTKPKAKRSSHWETVRKAHLKLHPACAACGETKSLEVHHIHPFSNDPELELDPNNLITLCECASHGICCHIFVGHAGDYTKYNPNVVADAAHIAEMFKNRLD